MCCKAHRKITRIMAERSELYHKATATNTHPTHRLQTDIDNKEIELLLAFAELKSNSPDIPETLTCADGAVYHLQEERKMQYRYVTSRLFDPDNVIRNPTPRIEQILDEVFVSARTDMLLTLNGEDIYIGID